MAVSIAVTSSLHGLRAVLFVAALHISVAAAQGPTKGADFVRVVPEQLHQRVPVFLGSRHEVEIATRYHLENDAIAV